MGFGDKLFFRKLPESSDTDDFKCNMEGVPTDGSNLVLRALDLFRERTSSNCFYEVRTGENRVKMVSNGHTCESLSVRRVSFGVVALDLSYHRYLKLWHVLKAARIWTASKIFWTHGRIHVSSYCSSRTTFKGSSSSEWRKVFCIFM